VAEAFENLHPADAGARIQRGHEARDEKRDSHAVATRAFSLTIAGASFKNGKRA